MDKSDMLKGFIPQPLEDRESPHEHCPICGQCLLLLERTFAAEGTDALFCSEECVGIAWDTYCKQIMVEYLTDKLGN